MKLIVFLLRPIYLTLCLIHTCWKKRRHCPIVKSRTVSFSSCSYAYEKGNTAPSSNLILAWGEGIDGHMTNIPCTNEFVEHTQDKYKNYKKNNTGTSVGADV